MRRLLSFATIVTALGASFHAMGQSFISSSVVQTFGPSGGEVVTIYSADRKYRVVIEDPQSASQNAIPSDDDEDDESAPKLDAMMVSGEGEKEKTLWRTKVSGGAYEYSEENGVIVSPDGQFFVVLPNLWRPHALRVYTASGLKQLEFPKETDDEVTLHETIADLEKISGQNILRVWDSRKDRWLAYTMPEGRKFDPSAELTTRWNNETRAKILQLFARRAQKELRTKIEESAPVLKRVTGLVAQDGSEEILNETHCAFLLARHEPADRKLFEEMLRKKRSTEGFGYGRFFCGTGLTWRDAYRFSHGDYQREQADSLLAQWDGKAQKNAAAVYSGSQPYRLARLSGVVKLAAPILTNAGKVHIHLIPQGKETSRWTNELAAEHLECPLPTASGLQTDLVDEISYSFSALTPGKYFAKAIWDKRAPTNDVMTAGPGDYESKLIGPLAIKAGDVITNFTIACTNRTNAGEAYYAADAAAVRKWKVTGELSPGMFASIGVPFGRFPLPPNDQTELFSRRAEQWILKTNVAPAANMPKVVRVALGYTDVWPRHSYHLNSASHGASVPALKFFFTKEPHEESFEGIEAVIIDDHGCEFRPYENYRAWFSQSAETFPKYPQSAKTFRLVGRKFEDQKTVWDLTFTNLVATNVAFARGDALPIKKDLGPVKLTISKLRIDDDELRMDSEFHSKSGEPASGWKLIESELTDESGVDVLSHGMCREQKSVKLRAIAVRNEESAAEKFTVVISKLPAAGKFLSAETETNICGLKLSVLGVAGGGTTSCELPIPSVGGSSSMSSGDDFEVEIRGRRVKSKSKERVAIVAIDGRFDDVILYLRNVGNTDEDSLGHDLEVGSRTRLFFIPLDSMEKNGRVELVFSADKKIAVEAMIQLPSDFKMSAARVRDGE